MKKLYFTLIFFVLLGFSVFGDNDAQEEVDFLLFMPNSGSQFVNEEQASIQLDNLTQYLLNKDLAPGQIIVYGYAAYAPNDIQSAELSRERALFVMNELQKRGISKDLFSDPVGYGAVYLWGNNDDENTRKLNRRVRVILDGESPIPITTEVIYAEEEPTAPEITLEVSPEAVAASIAEAAAASEAAPKAATKATPKTALTARPKKAGCKFFWWILPILVVLPILLFAFLLSGRKSKKSVHKNEQPPLSEMNIEPECAPAAAHGEAVTTWMVNLDEEIRRRAYEISQQREGRSGYQDEDWYNALHEISAWYTACGHLVFSDGVYWWASRSYNY